jgi:hypothetical protein
MDRSAVTQMVEDYWRTFVSLAQTHTAAAQDASRRFDERVGQTADRMEPLEASAFLQAVEAERERLGSEYAANPAAQKRRLGIPLGNDAPASYQGRSASNLGNLVVRTAVRATIWESIWALFRLGR